MNNLIKTESFDIGFWNTKDKITIYSCDTLKGLFVNSPLIYLNVKNLSPNLKIGNFLGKSKV